MRSDSAAPVSRSAGEGWQSCLMIHETIEERSWSLFFWVFFTKGVGGGLAERGGGGAGCGGWDGARGEVPHTNHKWMRALFVGEVPPIEVSRS